VEPELRIPIDGAVVEVRRLRRFLYLEEEIANAVEDPQVGVGIDVLVLRFEDLEPGIDCAPSVLGLEVACPILKLFKPRH
jgi:hypothetical protein